MLVFPEIALIPVIFPLDGELQMVELEKVPVQLTWA
jgi:hypothetical protein